MKQRVGNPTLSYNYGGSMEEKIKNLIKDVIEENNYILDDVEYVKEGSVYFLRVIIDKVGIMDVEDCVTVSNLINPILDKEDPIEDNYILDVCSKEKGSEEDE
jgi:ribosome maturation factor RimP